ncbi:MAG: cyclase family protein [Aurantimonas endophytica]|uniref:Kynurenine formamidase n=1 Tax=Aurantimonas endophytica TaxID=1522175 RepID=A0A7W6HDU1_9HYPH|nr:cyclase family protein [Aurantimonas endophytica]MBB4003396.1 kynurenine formamidase [Aurantimonas endophytica]MCO6404257.1 cyclase family protein [Aurantimonas endophytica]
MRIVDLSMPIEPHLRWPVTVDVTGDIAAGAQFRVSRLSTTCHGFTHVDAQAHFIAGAPTIEATPLERVVGRCRILDLRDVAPNEAIDAKRLSAADPGGSEGEILLLSSGWDGQRDYRTREFWTDSPYLTRDAAEWLADRKPTAIAFDFPQDYSIRLLLDGVMAPTEEHVTHDVCLRRGITLIEYLVNTASLAGPYCFLSAAPLKLPDADGSPSRVYAIEGLLDG